MNRIILIFSVLTLLSCSSENKSTYSAPEQSETIQSKNEEVEQVPEEPTEVEINPQVAVNFVNSYIDSLEKEKDHFEIRKWARNSALTTEDFNEKLDSMITDALKTEPEYGLGFDPILNAQDYPDRGFRLLTFDKATGLVTVSGIEWDNFQIKVQLVWRNSKTLVDGCGAVNLREELRTVR